VAGASPIRGNLYLNGEIAVPSNPDRGRREDIARRQGGRTEVHDFRCLIEKSATFERLMDVCSCSEKGGRAAGQDQLFRFAAASIAFGIPSHTTHEDQDQ
jgi:hypothetical protein